MKISDSIHAKKWQSFAYCLLAIAAAMLLLSGMSWSLRLNSAQAAQPFQPSAPSATDFAVGVYTDVYNLDPAASNWDNTSLLLVHQIYDTLTAYHPGNPLPQPSLALTWTVTDGITWTFQLRPGVTFHDGTVLDAGAVVFNFERWWDPANPYHDTTFDYFVAMFGGFKGDPNCFLSSVSAIGDDQVQIVLGKALYPLPGILSMPAFSIASPAAIQSGTLPEFPVGSGPFSLASHITDTQILLGANPDYWGGIPLVDTLTFQVIPTDTDRYAALLSGSLQSASDLPDEFALQAANDPQLQVLWRPSSSVGYLGYNSAHTPLGDPLVRQAIAHAIDLPALIESYYAPGSQLASQLLPPAIWGRDPDLSAYSYDPALSLSLLATAGYTDGFTTTLAYRNVWRPYLPEPVGAANAISTYLAAVGIQATPVEYESAVFLQKYRNGELDLFLLGWGADYLHPDNFLSPLLCDPTNLGLGPIDDILCAMVASAQADPDPADQLAAYQSASLRVYDTLPLLPVVHPRSALLLRDDVSGVQATGLGLENYKDAFITGVEQVIVDPETEANLVYYDEQSLPTILELPAGAVSETVLLRFVVTSTTSAPSGYASAGHGFELSAIDFGEPLPGFAFLQPVDVSIYYADSDVAGLQEDTLLLFYWDGTQWLDAATTCTPGSVYQRDLDANRIGLQICHLSTFGLFAEPYIWQFLPFVTRK